MPLLSSLRDAPEQVDQRAAQLDPWVMYLVVRSDLPASRAALLLAGARATARCTEVYADSPTWGESFRSWSERSFRKVTLRAKGSAWSKLESLDAGRAHLGGQPLVCALPPRLRSECGPLLRSLQVFNPDLASLASGSELDAPPSRAPLVSSGSPLAASPSGPHPDASHPTAPSMAFVLNPAAAMSVGKQMAQVAHAVLLCAWSDWARDPRYRDAFVAWSAAGHPCRLLPSSRWADLHAGADGVVVRDAGLTEVDPGTETVIALPPAPRPLLL